MTSLTTTHYTVVIDITSSELLNDVANCPTHNLFFSIPEESAMGSAKAEYQW